MEQLVHPKKASDLLKLEDHPSVQTILEEVLSSLESLQREHEVRQLLELLCEREVKCQCWIASVLQVWRS